MHTQATGLLTVSQAQTYTHIYTYEHTHAHTQTPYCRHTLAHLLRHTTRLIYYRCQQAHVHARPHNTQVLEAPCMVKGLDSCASPNHQDICARYAC